MWPILLGMALGIAVAWIVWAIIGLRWSIAQIDSTAFENEWRQVSNADRNAAKRHRKLSIYFLIFILLLLALSVIWYMAATSGSSLPDVPWPAVIFFGSHLLSGFLGFVLGALLWGWYIAATDAKTANVITTGAAFGLLATAVFIYGLNNDYKFVERLSKFSASGVTFELEKSKSDERVELLLNRTLDNVPAGNENISFSLAILEDLSGSALDRDKAAAMTALGGSIRSLELEANRHILTAHVKPLVALRKALHGSRLDSQPVFFDSDRLEQIKLSLALRELVMADLEGDDAVPLSNAVVAARPERVSKVVKAYANYVVSTKHGWCGLNPVTLMPKEAAKEEEDAKAKVLEVKSILQAGSSKEPFLKLVDVRQKHHEIIEKQACLDLVNPRKWEEQLELEARRLTGSAHIWALSEDCEEPGLCRDAIPDRQTIRSTPYMAIVASALLYGAGERVAAVSLLDLWQRTASQRKKSSFTEQVLADVYATRVINLMGLDLADLSNPVLLELGTNYQWWALEKSKALMEESPILKKYWAFYKFPSPDVYDMVASAAHPVSDRRNVCPNFTESLDQGARYFAYRRAILLNNVVYFLSFQTELLRQPSMNNRFNELVEELRSLRFDCLAFYKSNDKQVFEQIRTLELPDRLETLARAFRTQAILNKSVAKQAVCTGYKAVTYALRMAEAKNITFNVGNLGSKPLSDHMTDVQELAIARSTLTLSRELHNQLAAFGEGTCELYPTGNSRQ